jgi:hypothetical protein
MAQAILIHMAEVGAQQTRLRSMGTKALDHPIGRRFPQQHAEGGAAAGEGVADLSQEVVIETQIAQGA